MRNKKLPQYGSGIRGWFKYCTIRKCLIRIEGPKKIAWVAPSVITDEIPPTESMATQDREVFTSKAKLRRHYKQHGFVEAYGHVAKPETPDPEKRRKELRETIEKAYHDLKNDRVPLTEKEKEICRQETRKYEEWKKRNWLN